MKTLEEICKTPIMLLSEAEIVRLDLPTQVWIRLSLTRHAKEEACPKHEMLYTSTASQSRIGWHQGRCKHCGKDMSYDSGD